MSSLAVPQADMLQVSNSAFTTRKNILKFVPKIGLKCVNYREMAALDSLFFNSQSNRDYSYDPKNKLRPPKAFCQYKGACGEKIDHDLELINNPLFGGVERQPVVFPNEYGHVMNLDGRIRIDAHFSPKPCTIYKR